MFPCETDGDSPATLSFSHENHVDILCNTIRRISETRSKNDARSYLENLLSIAQHKGHQLVKFHLVCIQFINYGSYLQYITHGPHR